MEVPEVPQKGSVKCSSLERAVKKAYQERRVAMRVSVHSVSTRRASGSPFVSESFPKETEPKI